MQVQRHAQHRHQKGREQRQRFAEARLPRLFHALGIRQQLASCFSAAAVQLGRIQHAFGLLGLQFRHAFLVQRHVQCSAILFTLGTAAA